MGSAIIFFKEQVSLGPDSFEMELALRVGYTFTQGVFEDLRILDVGMPSLVDGKATFAANFYTPCAALFQQFKSVLDDRLYSRDDQTNFRENIMEILLDRLRETGAVREMSYVGQDY